MKFLLQVRFNGADTVIAELPAEEQQKVTAEFEAIRQSSGVLDGNQLQAASTAVTVRGEGGQSQVAKGLALEAGEGAPGEEISATPDPLTAPAVAGGGPAAPPPAARQS